VRYHVRDREGRELTVPTLADLAALHRQGFLGDEDEVRKESSPEWVPAAALLASSARRRRRDRRWVWAVLTGALALTVALALIAAARSTAGR
jgi:hypothetical protein